MPLILLGVGKVIYDKILYGVIRIAVSARSVAGGSLAAF